MTRLEWNAPGQKFFEAGVDRGVLFPLGRGGVPWNGLTAVSDKTTGGDPQPYYIDGVKYLNLAGREEHEGSIEAFTYPEEWESCNGWSDHGGALWFAQQQKTPFGLCYRTGIGNDLDGLDHAYKLHFVYNAMAQADGKTYSTRAETPSAPTFTWNFTTTPAIVGSNFMPTAHVVLDSRRVAPEILAGIEDVTYGSDLLYSRLPSPGELINLIPGFKVTDNGDGTFTVVGSDEEIQMLTDTQFEINSPLANPIDAISYTLSGASDGR